MRLTKASTALPDQPLFVQMVKANLRPLPTPRVGKSLALMLSAGRVLVSPSNSPKVCLAPA